MVNAFNLIDVYVSKIFLITFLLFLVFFYNDFSYANILFVFINNNDNNDIYIYVCIFTFIILKIRVYFIKH